MTRRGRGQIFTRHLAIFVSKRRNPSGDFVEKLNLNLDLFKISPPPHPPPTTANSCKDVVVPARDRAVVPTGLAIAAPHGTYARIAPRSGLAVKKFIDTGAGVVDEDYRGEVGVVLFNHSGEDFHGEIEIEKFKKGGKKKGGPLRRCLTLSKLPSSLSASHEKEKKPENKFQKYQNSESRRPRRAADPRAHRHPAGPRGRGPRRHGARDRRVRLDGREVVKKRKREEREEREERERTRECDKKKPRRPLTSFFTHPFIIGISLSFLYTCNRAM